MRKFILLVALQVSVGCGQRVYEGELQERQGLNYEPSQTEPFTGLTKLYYENGNFGKKAATRLARLKGL